MQTVGWPGWMDELFGKAAFRIEFREKHPQCMDCEHVNELIFDRRVYNNLILKKYCPSCPKFSKKTDGEKIGDGDD